MKRIVMMILLTALLLVGCASKEATWQEQYDLGMRYLSESNYEESLFAFSQAIAIDPKNADAYLGRAEAYLAAGGEENRTKATADYLTAADLCIDQGNLVRAEEILNEALEAIGESQMIRDKIEEIDGDTADRLYENQYYDDGTLMAEYEYDGEGNLLKESQYNTDGSLIWVREFDIQKNLVKESYYFYDDGLFDYYTTNEYDENGNPTISSFHFADGSWCYFYIFEYDEDGNRVKESWYDYEGNLEKVFEYDTNGKLLKGSFYNPDGSLQFYAVDEYDANGNRVKEKVYNPDGSLQQVFEYDEYGNRIN